MTELAIRQTSTVSLIQDTAADLTAAMQIAKALVETPFVPQHFRNKPEDAAAAILYGSTIQMDPTTALQNIYVIGGKPALYSRTMVAIALSKGHQIWTESEGEGTVTVCGQRKDSDRVESVTWNTAMANRAGYTRNAKYQTDPRSMLYARASGDIARRIAPDALLGMAYTVEELEIGEVVEDTVPARSGVNRLRAAIAPAEALAIESGPKDDGPADAPEEAPEPVEPAAEEPQPDTGTAPATRAQLSDIGKAFDAVAWTDKKDRLRAVTGIVGRTVAAAKDLTQDEAREVLDVLESCAKDDDPPQSLTDTLEALKAAAETESADEDAAVQTELGES